MAVPLPPSAIRPSGVVREPRWWLAAFAVSIQTAALSQLPFLQDNTLAKAGLSIVELATLVLLVWFLRGTPRLVQWIAVGLAFVVTRFLYAWLIGHLRYSSTLEGALQEGRFGLLIVIAPVAFLFFTTARFRTLGLLALNLAAALLLADLLVSWFFVRTGYLSLGGRSASRYVLSVLPLVLCVWIRIVGTIRSGAQLQYRDLALLIFAMLHIALFSTSRTEALICGAVAGQWIYVRTPNLRWPSLTIVLAVLYFAYTAIQPAGNDQIAGRDYRLALAYSRDAFPFGVGLVPEAVQKIQLGTAGTFFASDYGPILLIYRYGLVGIILGAALLAFWLRFLLRTRTLPGTFIVAAAVLVYFMIVPLLDYGSLIGGLLLGAMYAVMVVAPAGQIERAPAPAYSRLSFGHENSR